MCVSVCEYRNWSIFRSVQGVPKIRWKRIRPQESTFINISKFKLTEIIFIGQTCQTLPERER